VGRQDFLKVGFGHAQNGGVPMGVYIVGAGIAVQDGHIAKPYTWLHVGESDLLAPTRRVLLTRTAPLAHAIQSSAGVAPGGYQIAVFEVV
jgi:hypothetical protein